MATVLVVDEPGYMRDHVVRSLQGAGHAVLVAPGIQRGYELVIEHAPRIVFVGHDTEYKDGVGLAQTMRSRPQSRLTPCIALAIGADERMVRTCLSAGATGCIVDVNTPPSIYSALVDRLAYR